MKIEKVHIKNIKGIKDLELSFRKDNKILDVIVLAGVNGSGKTTILESIKDRLTDEDLKDLWRWGNYYVINWTSHDWSRKVLKYNLVSFEYLVFKY